MAGNIKYLFFLFFLFLFSFATLLIIPIAENPDYRIRAPEFINFINQLFPNFFFGFLYHYPDTGYLECNIHASVFTIVAKIEGCYFSTFLALMRAGLTTAIIASFLLLLRGYQLIAPQISVLYCALLSPGATFYLNLFSTEALFICLAIFIATYTWRWYFSVLLAFMFILDAGNSLVFTTFLIVRKFLIFTEIPLPRLIFFVVTILFCIASFRDQILYQAFSLTGYEKIYAIYTKIITESETHKYPVILRPIMTMLTFVDYKPSGASAFPASLIFWSCFVWCYSKTHKRLTMIQNLNIVSAFLVIMMFTFLLPQYTNAKYYIWAIVIFYTPIFLQLGFGRTIILSSGLNAYVLILFLFYRL